MKEYRSASGWIDIRYVIFITYMLLLAFVLNMVYITSHIAKPKFKVVRYAESTENMQPVFESYLIPQPDYLIASHSASFEVMSNGDLLAFWFAGSHEGKPDVKIWSSKFSGNRWGNAVAIVSPNMLSEQLFQFIHKVGNPVIYRAANGVLHLFVVSVGAIGGWSGSNIDHLQSYDGGATWNISQKLILSPLLNISTLVRTRAVPLEGGGFYLPVYHEMIYTYPELLRFDANGKLLQKIRMTSQHGLLQPAIIVDSGASAYAFLRNKGSYNNVLYMQYGKKGGLSWSKPVATNMTNRDSSVAVASLGYRKFLMVHNPIDRSRLVLSVSNNGLVWQDVMTLEDSPNMEYSYPDIQVHNGLIDILYTYDRKKIKHVRFNQAWLYSRHIADGVK